MGPSPISMYYVPEMWSRQSFTLSGATLPESTTLRAQV